VSLPPFTFGRTQNGWQTPFESEPDRDNGFTSKNVQEAIEEALSLSASIDRFLLTPSYGGNANVGRYLEIWPAIDSFEAPISVNATVKCVSINTTTVSPNATCTVEIYDITAATVLYTQTFTAVKQVINQGSPSSPLFTLPANHAMGIRIGSGSINKPYQLMTFSAAP
jgi:hypothetical protein